MYAVNVTKSFRVLERVHSRKLSAVRSIADNSDIILFFENNAMGDLPGAGFHYTANKWAQE